jgi:hypothetical protein
LQQPPKTGIDLSVEVTHKSVEEKEANPLIEILLQHDQAYRQDLKVKYKEQYGNVCLCSSDWSVSFVKECCY